MMVAYPVVEQPSLESGQFENEFILAQIEKYTLVIPSMLIAEVLIVDRTQILSLPFYTADIQGCINHEGKIVPLIASGHLLGLSEEGLLRPNLTVLRLSETAKQLSGVGLIIHQLLGNKSRSQLPPELFENGQPLGQPQSSQNMRLFDVEMIDPRIWQAQHWSIDPIA
jgi:chemotaxis signal transduction protein